MSKDKSLDFSNITINGVPNVSKNCLGFMVKTIKENGYKKMLEYGSGNSTIYFLREAMNNNLPLKEIVSVECCSAFFERMYNQILQEFKPEEVLVNSIQTQNLDFKRLKKIESQFILEHSWVNQHFEGCRMPFQRINFFFVVIGLKPLIRKIRLILNYLKMFVFKAKEKYNFSSNDLKDKTKNIEVKIRFKNNFVLRYILISIPSVDYINDGTYNRFHEYVDAPKREKYDLIFIDGRARVSCLKKIILDENLNSAGAIFQHDAFLENYWEGFNVLDVKKRCFMDGDNIKNDGTVLRNIDNEDQKHIVLNKVNVEKNETHQLVVNEMLFYS